MESVFGKKVDKPGCSSAVSGFFVLFSLSFSHIGNPQAGEYFFLGGGGIVSWSLIIFVAWIPVG